MSLLDHINEFVLKLEGDKIKMLETLLAATIEGKKLVLLQQNMSDEKGTIKYQFSFEEGEIEVLKLDDREQFIDYLVGRLSAKQEFSKLHPEYAKKFLRDEFEAMKAKEVAGDA